MSLKHPAGVLKRSKRPARTGQEGMPATLTRRLAIVIAIASLLLVGVVWAVSSPVGGSPDDDYHLSSIWCPRPLEGSGCEIRQEKPVGADQAQVPKKISEGIHCYAFKPNTSPECLEEIPDSQTTYTGRLDQGDYPFGYYQFHHMFVGTDIDRSVIISRIINVLLGIGGLAIVTMLAPRDVRMAAVLGAVVSWVPLGLYLVASSNPSSWALSGVLIYAVGLLGATRTQGSRQWALAACAAFGAVLACTSRADSAFFCLVVTLAVWFLAPIRPNRLLFAASVVVGLLGAFVMLTSGQSGALPGGGDRPNISLAQLVVSNLRGLPDFVAGFWAQTWGLGWFDVPMPGSTTYFAILVGGGALFVGAVHMYARKALSATVLAGAMLGIPVVIMVGAGTPMVYQYQPRYMLPLLAVFFMVWFLRPGGARPSLSATQAGLGVFMLGIAHSTALYATIRRYVTGNDMGAYDLNFNVEWWSGAFGSPMTAWILGSIAGVVALGALAWLATGKEAEVRS